MDKTRLIRLFLSCPSDVTNEVDVLGNCINDINKSIGKTFKFHIDLVHWKVDVHGDHAIDAQSVINVQVDNQYEILVGIIGNRIGTPTARDVSGTAEEISLAIRNEKKFLIYFNVAPPKSINEIDTKQLENVNIFKKRLSDDGVLYKEFGNSNELRSYLFVDIVAIIFKFFITHKELKENSQTEDFSSIKDVLKKAETLSGKTIEYSKDDIDFSDLRRYLKSCIVDTEDITNHLNLFTQITNNSTVKLGRLKGIKDVRLKNKKISEIVDQYADDLKIFNDKLNPSVASFSKHFRLMNSHSIQAIIIAREVDSDAAKSFLTMFTNLRGNITEAMESSASLLESILELPDLTNRFIKAKRECEVSFAILIREMLVGVENLDSVLSSK